MSVYTQDRKLACACLQKIFRQKKRAPLNSRLRSDSPEERAGEKCCLSFVFLAFRLVSRTVALQLIHCTILVFRRPCPQQSLGVFDFEPM